MKSLIIYLLCSLGVLVAAPQKGDIILGKCMSVNDGDTIGLFMAGLIYKVRLSGIDAPEQSQAYGTKATQALSSKIEGEQLAYEVAGYDRHGRALGKLTLDGESIRLWLVCNGWAWQYVKYDQSEELSHAARCGAVGWRSRRGKAHASVGI